MAECAYPIALVIETAPRHSALVRVTHWINSASFIALIVSGIAILVAHPRLYWGETGAVGTPSLIDLPLPFIFGPSGWGRYLHFLAAWVSVLTGLLYGISGILTRHFRVHLLPARSDLTWSAVGRVVSNHLRFRQPTDDEASTYNVVQRLTYLVVVFVLFPLMIWTGLAMSPAVTSVFPSLVTALGGQQSARTIHFIDASVLVIFLVVH